MTLPDLAVLGVGTDLPPAHAVSDLVREAGGDAGNYKGWTHVRVAEGDDHPSTMAARALGRAVSSCGASASDLRLVLSAGVSRDYPPSWSVATEVMAYCGAPPGCLGFDLTIGCMGTLVAMQVAQGWLAACGGGLAAIVVGERWAYTVDRSRSDLMGLWGHSDGGGAIVVGVDPGSGRAALRFVGAVFGSRSDMNGRVLIPYGGTRFPIAPEGTSPFERHLDARDRSETKGIYVDAYRRAFRGLSERFGLTPQTLVCNQLSTRIVDLLPGLAGIPEKAVITTGHDSGHMGGVDTILGLQVALDEGQANGPVAMAASTSYACGAGLLLPPETTTIMD